MEHNTSKNHENGNDANRVLVAVGQRCYMDKKIANGGMVKVVKVYDNNYCRVKCTVSGIEWDTSIYLLRNCH